MDAIINNKGKEAEKKETEKKGLKVKASEMLDKEITFTPRKVIKRVLIGLGVIGGAIATGMALNRYACGDGDEDDGIPYVDDPETESEDNSEWIFPNADSDSGNANNEN